MSKKTIIFLFFIQYYVNAQVVGTPYAPFVNNVDYILDNIPITDGGAYSVRKLISSYSGYCMMVRRSSDNTTKNIGFKSNGDLDTNDLLSFVGTGYGYVVTWYDQSGNGKNLNQTTNSYQPRIVENGSLNTENGKPFIRFYGVQNSANYNYLSLPVIQTTTAQVIIVNKFSGADGFLLGATNTYYWHSNPSTYLFANYSSVSIRNATIFQNKTQKYFGNTTNYPVWNTNLMVNSVAPQTPNSGTDWNNIGRDRTYHPITSGGGYSEIIFFSNAITTLQRTDIETNAMNYFNLL